MKIDFTNRYYSVGWIIIDSYYIKNFLVDFLKPKYKFNTHRILRWCRGRTIVDSQSPSFKESLNDFLKIGRYNNIYYTSYPKKQKEIIYDK